MQGSAPAGGKVVGRHVSAGSIRSPGGARGVGPRVVQPSAALVDRRGAAGAAGGAGRRRRRQAGAAAGPGSFVGAARVFERVGHAAAVAAAERAGALGRSSAGEAGDEARAAGRRRRRCRAAGERWRAQWAGGSHGAELRPGPCTASRQLTWAATRGSWDPATGWSGSSRPRGRGPSWRTSGPTSAGRRTSCLRRATCRRSRCSSSQRRRRGSCRWSKPSRRGRARGCATHSTHPGLPAHGTRMTSLHSRRGRERRRRQRRGRRRGRGNRQGCRTRQVDAASNRRRHVSHRARKVVGQVGIRPRCTPAATHPALMKRTVRVGALASGVVHPLCSLPVAASTEELPWNGLAGARVSGGAAAGVQSDGTMRERVRVRRSAAAPGPTLPLLARDLPGVIVAAPALAVAAS